MPTIEEILGLPPEGWKKIGDMTDEELSVYLKDITILEPTIPITAEPNKKHVLLEENEDGEKNVNPFNKTKKKKAINTNTNTKSSKLNKEEMDNLMEDLMKDL